MPPLQRFGAVTLAVSMSNLVQAVAARFDAYSRTAQLTPGLLLFLGPAAIAIGAGAPEWPVATTMIAAGAAMGLPVVLAEWVRRRGQRLQNELWAAWGGNPTVAALREEGLIAGQRRDALAAATGLPVDDPHHPQFEAAATNAVRRLISVTRPPAPYPLVFIENKAYGFARNLLAIRPDGVAVSSLALVGGIALAVISVKVEVLSTGSTVLGASAAAATTGFWLLYPSEMRVRAAAHDYRERLLEALDAGALSS